jgi:3',5'-cyclic AMP phosphodiesterase CpdA
MATRRNFAMLFLVAIAAIFFAAKVSLAAWSFGVISDTQWQPVTPENHSVAIHVVDAVNRQFVEAKVDLVLQVGDLTDDGTREALETRAAHNRVLAAAGIAFYPLRGNHEETLAAATDFSRAFPALPGTPGNGGSSPNLPGAAGHTYSFTHKGVKFLLLDQFTLATGSATGRAYSMAEQQPWIDRELAAKDHQHAFVLAHKPLVGKHHKDNLFGWSDDRPDVQNAFFAGLSKNGVRYYICGHDHLHFRSLIASLDGRFTLQQIIGASDSYKFYKPKKPDSPRERSLAKELERIGYYVYTIDGPRVIARYYSAAPFGKEPADPKWEWRETFGYSLNGKEFLVRQDDSYTSVSDSIVAGEGYVGTAMSILAGTNSAATTPDKNGHPIKLVTSGWSPKSEANLQSDVLSLWGMALQLGSDETAPFVISMSLPQKGLDEAILKSGRVGIMSRDAKGKWRLAIDANHGGRKKFVAGPWNKNYELGTYGVDLATNTAWAVINQTSDFAVGTLPD